MESINQNAVQQRQIEWAKQKLKNHQTDGANSKLSIFQVAELFDMISGNSVNNHSFNQSIFGTFSLN